MSSKKQIILITLILLFTSLVLSTVCFAAGENVGQEGDLKVLNVVFNTAPVTLDPANHRHRDTQQLFKLITAGLMISSPEGNHVLDLAESINLLDPVTYEIKIRKDAYFHNGDQVTADDVIFSVTRLGIEGGMEGETSPRKSLVGPIESMEKKDDFTVILKLEKPNQIVQQRNWTHYEIIPKKYFEEVGLEGFMKHPIGCGPFKWVEGDLRHQIILDRNENYFNRDYDSLGQVDRMPGADRIILSFIADATTRVAALLAGDVDTIENVPVDSIKLLENDPNTKVVSDSGTTIVLMHLNTTKPPFNDKRVRQAIAYAIDYELFTKTLHMGYSDPLYGLPFQEPYPGEPGSGAFNDVEGHEYNPEKAKALIEEAGVSGVACVIDTVSEYTDEAQAIAQMMNDVGINASVRIWELAVIMDEFKKGERDIYYGAIGNGRKAPQWSYDVVGTKRPHNYSQYSNPVFDGIMQEALEIVEDSPERNAKFKEAFEIILDDCPIICVHAPHVVNACRSDVINFHAYPSVVTYLRVSKQ